MRLVVVGDPRKREPDGGDDRRGRNGARERDERVEPLAVEPDPDEGGPDREDDPEARKREHDCDERDVDVQRPGRARAQRPVTPPGEP